jgi:hypothetical protein
VSILDLLNVDIIKRHVTDISIGSRSKMTMKHTRVLTNFDIRERQTTALSQLVSSAFISSFEIQLIICYKGAATPGAGTQGTGTLLRPSSCVFIWLTIVRRRNRRHTRNWCSDWCRRSIFYPCRPGRSRNSRYPGYPGYSGYSRHSRWSRRRWNPEWYESLLSKT